MTFLPWSLLWLLTSLPSSTANAAASNNATIASPFQTTTPLTDANLASAVHVWCERPSLAEATYGHISTWNTSTITSMRGLFRRQETFHDDISQWDTSRVRSMSAMFEFATTFDQDLSQWNTANVHSMSAMFADASSFSGQGLNHWNVHQVKRMDRMFHNAIRFNGNLSSWITDRLVHVTHMFHNAISFTGQHPCLAHWNTSQVVDFTGLFAHAISFVGNVSAWDTDQVTNMQQCFQHCEAFDGDVGPWKLDRVTNAAQMFDHASSFTGKGLEHWKLPKVRNLYRTFANAVALQADISAWRLPHIQTMDQMLYNAKSFGTQQQAFATTTPSQPQHFPLLCWDIGGRSTVSMDQALCGAHARMDPCCVSTRQFQQSCCNHFCYNTTTTCPDGESVLVEDTTYSAEVDHLEAPPIDPSGYDTEAYASVRVHVDSHAGLRIPTTSPPPPPVGAEWIVLLVAMLVISMVAFGLLVYYC